MNVLTCTHTHTQTQSPTRMHCRHTHTDTHAYFHAHRHTCILPCTHRHIHMHTYTRTLETDFKHIQQPLWPLSLKWLFMSQVSPRALSLLSTHLSIAHSIFPLTSKSPPTSPTHPLTHTRTSLETRGQRLPLYILTYPTYFPSQHPSLPHLPSLKVQTH